MQIDFWAIVGYLWDFAVHLATLNFDAANDDYDKIRRWFEDAFQQVWDWATKLYYQATDWAWAQIQILWGHIDSLWGTITSHWNRLSPHLWRGFYYITDYILNVGNEARNTVWGWVQPTWNWIGLDQWSFSNVVGNVRWFLYSFQGELENFASNPLSYIRHHTTSLYAGIEDFFTDPFPAIRNYLSQNLPFLSGFFQNPLKFVEEQIKAIWRGWELFVKNPFSEIDKWIRSKVPLYDLLRDNPKKFIYTLLEDFNPDFADFARDPLGWLWDKAVPYLVNKTLDWLEGY
ncbi:MAG: hypothetical protein HWN68_11840 [Desulfobacterales bacterium]|nr:hypothetical protein [Desulfobacterales bacterium]